MHAKANADDATDSMKMFRMGLEDGKPAELPGVQPEWFYKGNGAPRRGPGGAARSRPAFALDGGEEPEIAGIYVIGAGRRARARRLGARPTSSRTT